MLSVFPKLFTYQLLSLFTLRVIVALVLIFIGYAKVFKKTEASKPFWQKTNGVAELAAGILFLPGFLTQPAAILAILTALTNIVRSPEKALHLLLIAGSLVLLFSGPGIFAIDIPL